RLDAIGSTSPVATDIRLEATDANGVAAEWSLAPGSDPSKVLLFFHGGGDCSGSIVSHRGMVTEVGRAAPARKLALAYPRRPRARVPCGARGCARSLWFSSRSRDRRAQDRARR